MSLACKSDTESPSIRRWLRFSLRSLFVVVLVTIPFAYVARERQEVAQREKDIATLADNNIVCVPRSENEENEQHDDSSNGLIPRWLIPEKRRTLEVQFRGTPANVERAADALNRITEYKVVEFFPESGEFVALLKPNPNVSYCNDYQSSTDESLEHVIRLYPNCSTLVLNPYGLTDTSGTQLNQLNHLEEVNLDFSDITDQTVRALGKCRKLKELNLNFTRVTDEGIAHLGNCTELRRLRLRGTNVTGEVLKTIAKLRNLGRLDIAFTRIDSTHAKELAALLESLPRFGHLFTDQIFMEEAAPALAPLLVEQFDEDGSTYFNEDGFTLQADDDDELCRAFRVAKEQNKFMIDCIDKEWLRSNAPSSLYILFKDDTPNDYPPGEDPFETHGTPWP